MTKTGTWGRDRGRWRWLCSCSLDPGRSWLGRRLDLARFWQCRAAGDKRQRLQRTDKTGIYAGSSQQCAEKLSADISRASHAFRGFAEVSLFQARINLIRESVLWHVSMLVATDCKTD